MDAIKLNYVPLKECGLNLGLDGKIWLWKNLSSRCTDFVFIVGCGGNGEWWPSDDGFDTELIIQKGYR